MSSPLTDTPGSARRVLLVTNTRRDEALLAARTTAQALLERGLVVAAPTDEWMHLAVPGLSRWTSTRTVPRRGCELVVVLGGDGTLLRAPSGPAGRACRCWA